MDLFLDMKNGPGLGALRVGIIKHIYADECAAQVQFPDIEEGEFVSFRLPVLQHGAGQAARAYWLPAEGDQVLCAFLPHAQEVGFVLGGFYAPGDAIPLKDATARRLEYENGDFCEYIEADRVFKLQVGSTYIEVKDGEIKAGSGAEEPLAIASKVKAELDGIKGALDELQRAFNSHVHSYTCGTAGPLVTMAAPSSTIPTTAAHTYAAQEVKTAIIKGE